MLGRLAMVVMVAGCSRELTFATTELPPGTVGVPYQVEIELANADTRLADVRATGLPPGLTLEYDSRENQPPFIRGTPTVAGTSTVTIQASCFGTSRAGRRGQHTYQLVIAGGP